MPAKAHSKTWKNLFYAAIVVVVTNPILTPFVFPHFGYGPKAWISICGFLLLARCFYSAPLKLLAPRSLPLKLLGLFFLWSVLSLLWSTNIYYSLLDINNNFAALSIIFVVSFALVQIPLQRWAAILQKGIAVIIFATLLLILLALAQYWWSIEWFSQFSVPGATFGNKNMTAQSIAIALPLGIALLYLVKDSAKMLFVSVFLVLGFATIVFTQTRGVWLAVIVTLVIQCICYRRFKFSVGLAPRYLASIVVVVVIAISSLSIISRHSEHNRLDKFSSKILTADQSVQERLVIWRNTVALIQQHWLIGTGIGNWSIQYPLYMQTVVRDDKASDTNVEWLRTHNDFLQWFAELGLIGILLLLASLVLLVQRVWRKLADEQHQKLKIILIACTSSLLVLVISAQFSFPLRLPYTLTFAAVLLGVLIAYTSTIFQFELKHSARQLGLVISLCLCAIVSYAHYNGHKAWGFLMRATEANRQQRLELALTYSLKAYEHNRLDSNMLTIAANSYRQLSRLQKSTTAFETIYRDFPNRKQVLQNLASNYVQLKQFQNALSVAERWVELVPDSYKANSTLGSVHYYLKNYRAMTYFYRKALAINPKGLQSDLFQQLIQYYPN